MSSTSTMAMYTIIPKHIILFPLLCTLACHTITHLLCHATHTTPHPHHMPPIPHPTHTTHHPHHTPNTYHTLPTPHTTHATCHPHPTPPSPHPTHHTPLTPHPTHIHSVKWFRPQNWQQFHLVTVGKFTLATQDPGNPGPWQPSSLATQDPGNPGPWKPSSLAT